MPQAMVRHKTMSPFDFLYFSPRQMANYGIGGHYDNHMDIQIEHKEPYSPPVMSSDDPETGIFYQTGDRMSTFMLYLTDVPKAGFTFVLKDQCMLFNTLEQR